MAQYDVHEPEPGFMVVSLQSDWLDASGTGVVAPLLHVAELPSLGLLTPGVQVGEHAFRIAIHLMATVRTRDLRRVTCNVSSCRDDITRALDFLFAGF